MSGECENCGEHVLDCLCKQKSYPKREIMSWLTRICTSRIKYLPINFCKDKTNKQLIEMLKTDCLSENSGNLIVAELLERIIDKLEKDNK